MIHGWKVRESSYRNRNRRKRQSRVTSQGVIDVLVIEEVVRSADLIGKRLALGRVSHLVQYVDDSSVVVLDTIFTCARSGAMEMTSSMSAADSCLDSLI